jgi:hypothetical protein
MTAVTTEFELGGIDIIALGARAFKSGAAVAAVLDAFRVLKLALRALHVDPPSRGLSRYTSEGMPIYI